MRAVRFSPRRYQLDKKAAKAVQGGHPWIFRSHMSSAANSFRDGQWLKLVDSANTVIGYGVFAKSGLIAIRVLKRGLTAPDNRWLKGQIQKALDRRKNVQKYTDAVRWVHGENDGFPGIVIEGYADSLVLQTYASSMDVLGRWAAAVVNKARGGQHVLWRFPVKRQEGQESSRWLRGGVKTPLGIREGEIKYAADIWSGQKTGTFLDLRALRKWIALQKLGGKRVLNLFAYTGMQGQAAEKAGAKDIWNVDVSKQALDFAKAFHTEKPGRQKYIVADIFKWFSALDAREKFDLVILDPPLMASQVAQVENALRVYRKLYQTALGHLAPGGTLVVCCCSSRISRPVFAKNADQVLRGTMKFLKELGPEEDHPVGFPEGDYLKIRIYRYQSTFQLKSRLVPRTKG